MQEVDIIEPRKHLLRNTNSETINKIKYTYFIAEKSKKTIFGSNPRLFILKQNQNTKIKEFGYARELPKDAKVPFKDEKNIPERKHFFNYDNLKQIIYNNKQGLEIHYLGDKGELIKWVLSLDSQQLAENVNTLLNNARHTIINVVDNKLGTQTLNGQKVENPPSNTTVPVNSTFTPPDTKTNPSGNPNDPNSTQNPFVAPQNKQEGKQQNKEVNDNKNTGPRDPAPTFGGPTNANQPQKQPNDNTTSNNNSNNNNNNNTNTNNSNNNTNNTNNNTNNNSNNQNKGGQTGMLSPTFDLTQQNAKQQNQKKQKQGIKNQQHQSQMRQIISNFSQQYLKNQKQVFGIRQDIINNKNQEWNYQFLKGNQENLVNDFKEFTESFIGQLVDEMCLPMQERSYRPIDKNNLFENYKELGLDIRLCFSGFKEIKSVKNSREMIVDESELKKAVKEFKNMNYLLSITRNKGKIRLPLANVVEYKGVIALVKAEVETSDEDPVSLMNQLEVISKQSRIGKQVFQNPKFLTISPLHHKAFESRSHSPRKNRQTFSDIFYINNVNNFLPTDLNFIKKDPQNLVLRSQLLQNQDFDGMKFMGVSVSPFLNKIKTERNVQVAVGQLEELSKRLRQNVTSLLEQWEFLDVKIFNSKQIQDLFHKHGVNMRYLGMVYDQSTVPLVRKICMSEIITRSAKIIFRASVQQMIRTYSTSIKSTIQIKDRQTQINECNTQFIQNLIQFLNGVASETKQSEFYWKNLNKQAEYNFNVSITKLQVSEQYFLQALIYHLSVDIDWSRLPKKFKLFSKKIFKKQMINKLNYKTKNYNLNFTDLYNKINYLLEQGTADSAEQIKSILNIRKLIIPSHFKLNGTYDKLCLFLSIYTEPQVLGAPSSQMQLSNTIYKMVQLIPVSYTSLSISISQIKWNLKNHKLVEAERLLNNLIKKISEWVGDTHPIYTDIYSVFAHYYAEIGNYELAMNYSKTALANMQKILGDKHQKISERYWQLAEIGFQASRKVDSLNNFNRAKNICSNNGQTQTIFYAEVCYKVAVLSFQLNKITQALNSILQSVEIYENNRGENGDYQNEIVDCYEFLMRIYEFQGKKEEMENISTYFYHEDEFKNIKDLTNIQKIMRIFLIPYFVGVDSKKAEKMVKLFKQIPLQFNTSSYSISHTYIKKLIDTNKLIPTITEIFDNFDALYDEVIDNSILTRWKRLQENGKSIPHQCISLIEALIYFVGEGFVIGSLQQR